MHRTTNPAPEGVLLIDKPAGMTSHDVVAVARRSLRTRRIGHTGTLDPFATGLLVLLVGRATRLLPYVDSEPKVYDAVIAFGEERTTDDRTGDVVRRAPPPSGRAIDEAIAALTGQLSQVPPSFSAKQKDGVRAYAAARRGKPIDLPAAAVRVHAWEILDRLDDSLSVRIVCGTGTYIRALARDLGRLAGGAAHLAELRRVAAGPFSVADAVRIADGPPTPDDVRPQLAAIRHIMRRELSDTERDHVTHGRSLPADAADPPLVAAVGRDGALVAVLGRAGDVLRPRVVLADD